MSLTALAPAFSASWVAPYSTPIGRELLAEELGEALDRTDLPPDLQEHFDMISGSVLAAVDRLPERIVSKKNFSNRFFWGWSRQAKELKEKMGFSEEDSKQIAAIVKRQAALIFYGAYIAECREKGLAAYCQAQGEPPQSWGIGSIFHWGGAPHYWGRAFYNFWRNNIERKSDTIFRKEVLPSLPKTWQDRYRPKAEAQRTPFPWKKMSPQEIAAALQKLISKRDPAKGPWLFGSVIYWTGPHGEMWGKTFWAYWRKYVEKTGSSQFQKVIVPLLPAEWQKNYQPDSPYDWKTMSYRDIAKVLTSLHRPFRLKKWGPGSISRWSGPQGEKWGRTFYTYLTSVAEDHESWFRKHILPLMPKTDQQTYRPVGYVIPMKGPNRKDKEAANRTDDLEELYLLAAAGNFHACEKLKSELAIYIQEKFPGYQVPPELIERMIHMYIPGDLKKYVRVYIRDCNRPFRHFDERVFGRVKHGRLAENQMENEWVERIDLKAVYSRLKDEGVSPEVLRVLFDLLSGFDDITLEDIARGNLSGEAKIICSGEVQKAARLCLATRKG